MPDTSSRSVRGFRYRSNVKTVSIHHLPSLVAPSSLARCNVVVVDVLRASTTITHALASGAREMQIFPTPEAAIEAAAKRARGDVVLGGERGGVRLDGFDLGNSPREYAAANVGGKSVLFTTTNGTAAALHAREAARVLFGCFNNLGSVANRLVELPEPIHILCAGTNCQTSLDDILFAGALAAELMRRGVAPADVDSVMLASWAYEHAVRVGLAASLAQTRGGRGLVALGFGPDIDNAAELSTLACVGEMAQGTSSIRPVAQGATGR